LLSGVLVALASGMMVIEVISRYFFHISHGFMDEIPRYLVIFATFMIAPINLKLGQHINIDIIPGILKGRKKSILMFTIHFLTLLVCIFIVIASINGVIYHYRVGTIASSELEIPLWILILVMAIGSVLLSMYAAELLIRTFLSLIGTKIADKDGPPS